ncbi:hypothetical protein Bca52824_095410 [Brassica carinata]|uniref:Ubiquitin-like domain-containing protein n=1 Tax=Brassica carinata TaxID=52824 RepID=A0A8X7TI82_BRACI|nr:hypothetical protein Bca52824_095410 [Brassica carinata]
MAMIDWHDFVVVESIDFADDEDEELPPPMTLEEVIRRSKVSAAMEEDEVVEPGKEVEMEMDEEEMKLVADGMRAANLEESGGSVKVENMNEEAPMRIVKNWKRPEDRIPTERDPTKVVISPITGELIPINEMSEHMRISLIDPKFKEQKDRFGLARLRPDIFGTTEEEVSNAVKAEIEKKKDEQPMQVAQQTKPWLRMLMERSKLPWSSCSSSSSTRCPNSPPLPPPPNLALNLPRPPPSVQYPGPPRPLGVPMMQAMHPQHQHSMPGHPGHPMMMNRPAQMQPGGMPPPPGSQFIHLQGSATIRVSVPNVDEGQVIEITVQSLSENVGSLKEKIAGETQIPANKQKLSGKAGFLKDNMSLAHYNVGAGEILTLSLRERGGRKR